MMETNGFKASDKVKHVFTIMAQGNRPPEEATSPVRDRLMEMCRRKREQGVDTSGIERLIEESMLASIRSQTLYSQVMLRIAYDSLQ
jgi:hypothetical protein